MLWNNRISIAYFINVIKLDIIIIFTYALVASALMHTSFLRQIEIPLSISAMLATLVSLLLAFKTSQSYERWWEARILWGGIVNDSRTLIRLLKQHLPPGADTSAFLESFTRRHIIFCYSLGDSLRKATFSGKVQEYLTENKIDSANVPNYLLNQHSADLAMISKKCELNANIQVQLDTVIASLNNGMGACERIKNTVFPKSYSLLLRSIIYVFLTIFPFGLVSMFTVGELMLTTMIPILFISIERTAIILQDPFENRPTDTPVTKIAQTIERNLEEMLGMQAAPQKDASGAYYVM